MENIYHNAPVSRGYYSYILGKYSIKGSHLNMYTIYKLRLYVTTKYYSFNFQMP